MGRLWKKLLSRPILCLCLIPWFTLFLLWNAFYSKVMERFEDTPPQPSLPETNNLLKKMEAISSETGAFQRWIGYVYAHPATSANALNDIKERVLEPSCEFRMDWSSRLPNGLEKPVSSITKDEANASYNTFLRCASKNGTCQKQLDEFILRFMKPGCQINRQTDFSTLATDLKPIFK